MLVYLTTTCIALTASLFLTPLARYLGPKLGAMDIPNELSIHSSPTPRSGGLAIFLGFLAAALYGLLATDLVPPADETRVLAILLASGITFMMGLLGDMGVLPSGVELFALVVPSAVVMLSGVVVLFVPPLLVSIPLTLFYLVGGSAAMNLLDGMDGLAAGVAGVAATFFAILCLSQGDPAGALLALALLGSCMGFLRYNFHDASIFMGDGGSLFLGFILSNLAILLTTRPYDFVWFAAPILVIGVPAFDTFLAVMRRAVNEKGVLWGDRRHIYDLLRARGWGDRRTVLCMYGLSATLGVAALLVTRLRSIPAMGLLSLGFLLALWAAHRLGALRTHASFPTDGVEGADISIQS